MDNGYAAWIARWRVPLGLALGTVYLVLAQPSGRLLFIGATIALGGLTLRAWSAGYLDKNERLTTQGPYARTRNPLYLGSFFIGVGLVIAGARIILAFAFLIFFLAAYFPVIRREEDGLQRLFGEAYERYAERVPLLIPAVHRAEPNGEKFRWSRYRKNHEYEAALGYAVVVIFLALKIKLR